MEERKQQACVRAWDRETAELAEQFSTLKELKKPVTYIRNGLGDWYTCLPPRDGANKQSQRAGYQGACTYAEDHRYL